MSFQVQAKTNPNTNWVNLTKSEVEGNAIKSADQYKASGIYSNVRVINTNGNAMVYQA